VFKRNFQTDRVRCRPPSFTTRAASLPSRTRSRESPQDQCRDRQTRPSTKFVHRATARGALWTQEEGRMTSEQSWHWDSSGGCEACDALQGYHEQQPCRPHPGCTCEPEALDIPEADCGYVVTVWHLDNHHTDSNPSESDTFTMEWAFEIECFDGLRGLSGTLELEVEYGPFWQEDAEGPWQDVESRALEKAEELADELCTCEEDDGSSDQPVS